MKRRFIDYTGKRFGRLTFIRRLDEQRSGKYLWELQCDCGEVIRRVAAQVARPGAGPHVSCGCRKRECAADRARANRRYDPIVSSARQVWRGKYKDGDIDFGTFYHLSQQPCDYCGAVPQNVHCLTSGHDKPISEFQKKEGTFIYNGLDRVDNTRGHDVDNVVPCCFPCNRAKGTRTRAEFLAHNERIYLHNHP